jgi:outer membrane protein
MFKKLIVIGLSFASLSISAQDTWTLERCISYAQENSRQVKQSQIQVKSSKLVKKQDDWSRYPSVSANSNLGFNFGRSVNPSTYQFENNSSNYNSWGVSLGAPIYNGGRITNQIKQSAIDIKAAEADLEQSVSNIALQVAQVYLQILLNEEQYENTRKRSQTTASQLDRIEKQIKAGQLPPNARYDLLAQAAKDEQNIVSAANNVELSYLNLKNLLELSPETPLKIERPQVVVPNSVNPESFMFKGIYNQALGNQPNIRASELRIKSAETGVKIAQAALMPTLSANANLGTNYSSTIPDYSGIKTEFVDVNTPVKIDGRPAVLTTQQPKTTTTNIPKKTYGSQIGDNFGQSVGLNLSIPIFSGFSRQIGVERQKLAVESQMLVLERDKQQLKTDVQNAIASARAAKKQYDAAMKSFEAQKAAFESLEKRFQIGSANSFEFTQSKNNVDTAERDVTVAKYDYLFRLKIVEFYEGKRLSLR